VRLFRSWDKIGHSFDDYGTPLQYFRNESNLAGDKNAEYSHWLEWSWENDIIPGNGVGTDDTGLSGSEFFAFDSGKAVLHHMKMINPLPYLTSIDGDSAPFWYVRHGMRDRDTSFAVEEVLFQAIENDKTIKNANCALAYMQPHAGNYDVQEAYSWLADCLEDVKEAVKVE